LTGLSVIIPAREEQYLEKTIQNVLDNARGKIEIIVELDGWIPDPQITLKDERVIFVNNKECIGQRACINHAVSISKCKYIMKLDAHCAVDEGFDIKLAADCEPEWTVIPRMYNLDIKTWKPKLHKLTDYMYITSPTAEKPFRAMYYSRRHKPTSDKLIDETMCNMGPCWFMHKERFLAQGGCDEGHEGGWGQQGIEVSLKAWLSGGKLVVNKKTWFSHWFRGGSAGGFPYPMSGRRINRVREYSKDLWLNDKWPLATKKLDWLINKFNPPGWGEGRPLETDITRIKREIRHTFNTRTQNDFPPYAGIKGDRIDLLDMFGRLGFTKGAEIGVNRASYSREMLRRIPDLHLSCIDPWGEYKYSHRTEEGQNRDYGIAMEKLKPWVDIAKCEVIKDCSYNVHHEFKDGSLDFIYIDGAHDFDNICLDLIYWCPKVRKGGIIAVHDYFNFRRGGVVDAVNAYTKNHMIEDWYTTKEVMPTAFWIKHE